MNDAAAINRTPMTVILLYFFATPHSGVFAAVGGTRSNHPTAEDNVVVWVEVNAPQSPLAKVFPEPARSRPGSRIRDYCLESLNIWGQVGIVNAVIVSTRPGKVEGLYPFLKKNAPGHLTIIGGLKTYLLPGATPKDPRPYDYANLAGWRRLADEATRIMQITGQPIVLFESETALVPFHAEGKGIAYDRLGDSLAPLRRSGATVLWWYPSVLTDAPHAPDRHAQTIKLVRTVAEAVPNSAFIAAYGGRNDWRLSAGGAARREEMANLVGDDRLRDILYVTMDGYIRYGNGRRKRCYTPDEAFREITTRSGHHFVLYPCSPKWVEIARAFRDLAPRDQ